MTFENIGKHVDVCWFDECMSISLWYKEPHKDGQDLYVMKDGSLWVKHDDTLVKMWDYNNVGNDLMVESSCEYD